MGMSVTRDSPVTKGAAVPGIPFQMRVTKEFLREIDAWRIAQPEILNRAEAIRQLVRIGLDARPPELHLAPRRGPAK
jgi:hypothetical protein